MGSSRGVGSVRESVPRRRRASAARGTAFMSVNARQRPLGIQLAKDFVALGFNLGAAGTQGFSSDHGSKSGWSESQDERPNIATE